MASAADHGKTVIDRRLKTIWVLQAGRALAALAVVAHHASASTETFAGKLPPLAHFLAAQGYLGVDFFFVLSGFIIHYINRHSFDLRHYVSSRALRVYAPYLPIGIGIALAYTLLPSLSAGTRHWDWLSTLTLLPGSPALIVAWTLEYEIIFYAVYGLARLAGHPIIGVVSWVAVAIAYNLFIGTPTLMAPLLGRLTIEFLFGMIAVELVDRKWRTLIPAVVVFIAFCFLSQIRELFGLSMALLIVHLVQREQSGELHVRRAFRFFGAASYSIYLVHNPVCALVARFFNDWALSFASTFVIGAGAGVVYHVVVERTLLRLGRRRNAPGELHG